MACTGNVYNNNNVRVTFLMTVAVVGLAMAMATVSELQPPKKTPAHVPGYRSVQGRVRNHLQESEQPCQYKDIMTNLHDRVGVLATLDEDQRNRLELLDKKVDRLIDSNKAREESLKVELRDLRDHIDSFERTSSSTLNELKGDAEPHTGRNAKNKHTHKLISWRKLKDISRNTRATPQNASETHIISDIFNEEPGAAAAMAPSNRVPSSQAPEFQLDVPQKLDALATLLTSTAINLNHLQNNLSRLTQTTYQIQQRLNMHRRKGQQKQHSAALPSADWEAATSCLQSYAAVNNILKLQLTPESEPFYVPCEQDGWTVVLHRFNGALNFERSWLEYKEGFGNLAGEFFIGLDKLHAMTASAVHELRIMLRDFDGVTTTAEYSLFGIASEKELYTLNLLGRYKGESSTAGDSLSYHAGAKFTTFDHDNDNCVSCNCALDYKGGWWYNWCAESNLHGVYGMQTPSNNIQGGLFWRSFHGLNYSMSAVQMLIRPVVQD